MLGFGVQGLGFRVLGFGVWGLGFRVLDLGFRVSLLRGYLLGGSGGLSTVSRFMMGI